MVSVTIFNISLPRRNDPLHIQYLVLIPPNFHSPPSSPFYTPTTMPPLCQVALNFIYTTNNSNNSVYIIYSFLHFTISILPPTTQPPFPFSKPHNLSIRSAFPFKSHFSPSFEINQQSHHNYYLSSNIPISSSITTAITIPVANIPSSSVPCEAIPTRS